MKEKGVGQYVTAWQNINQLAKKYHQSFHDSLKHPIKAQTTFLERILVANKTTQFGQEYRFDKITSIEEFQSSVPIQNYETLEPYIDDNFNHSSCTLSNHPTQLFERTSGSSGSSKIIPYNELSLEGFRHAIFPWLYDLSAKLPDIKAGSSYWSISPVGRQKQNSPSGVPIGMSNDAFYFGSEAVEHIQTILSVPGWVSQITSIDAWRYVSLRFLLCDDSLRLISIWSPTFLIQLINTLLQDDYAINIISDIANGDIRFSELALFQSEPIFEPNLQRATTIAQAFSVNSDGKQAINTELLWPKLQLISCWSSAGSRGYAKQLQELFPNVLIQTKGLLATEGAITLPLLNMKDTVLSIHSGFFEFVADNGKIYLCNELVTGETYAVLVTNFSGLYRYNIGDLVKVMGWHQATPCLQFQGRAGLSTDLCGEKLTENFVLPYLNKIPGFTLLVPYSANNSANNINGGGEVKPHYRLYLDADRVPVSTIETIAQQIDMDLSDNPQYAYARNLGQLGSVKVILCVEPYVSYEGSCMDKGMGLGDIKPASINPDENWHACFKQTA